MNPRAYIPLAGSVLVALCLAALGEHIYALGFLLFASMAILAFSDDGKPGTKTAVTAVLGATGFFIYAIRYGIPATEGGNLLLGFERLSEAIHLDIFVFLAGLYLVVNTFAYSGFIGDLAWRIVRKARGRLDIIMVAIMFLTCLLSGIFDGATIASIMGVVTLTILLSSGMKSGDIVKILLLLAIATNIGGVWFVLGEPTNILAASKLGLSPFFFTRYASLFALPAAAFCAFAAWRTVRRYPRIKGDRPEIEVLLEGLSLRRTHEGRGSLAETLESIGTVEVGSLAAMKRIMEEEGLPDFEAALKAGVPQKKVHAALSVNLNSEELATGLIEYYQLSSGGGPGSAEVLANLLARVRGEYEARTGSRRLIFASGAVLIALLVAHAFIPTMPTWTSTVIAGLLAIAAVKPNARRYILAQTGRNLAEALFLMGIFLTITEINAAGGFELLGKRLLNLGSVEATGAGILAGSAVFSAIADNVAVMDVLTNLIAHHEAWSFFALAAIVGTALGGFVSPIASVQAVIMATIIRRVSKTGFGSWVRKTLPWFLILLAASAGLLVLFHALGLPPMEAPRPQG